MDTNELVPEESSSFEQYFLNQNQLATNRKLATILLMLADFENLMWTDGNSTTIIAPEMFIKRTSPYSEYSGKKGWRKKLIVSKQEIAKEMTRRSPHAKVNKKTKPLIN